MNGPRVAVVLGAGGMVGHAFHAGVLDALASELGWDARRADLMVGTSAGSLVAAMLRAGLPATDLAARATGRPLSPAGAEIVARAGLGPPRRRPRPSARRGPMASPARLSRALRAPWEISAGSLAAAVLPAGSIPTGDLGTPVDALYGDTWPGRSTWVVAVELDTGRRVAFGRPGAAPARMADAVQASCAIPAFFEPVVIDGRRYVDGGVHSTTNADLVGGERPDLVLVSAPMSAARGALRFGPSMAIRRIAQLSLVREVAALRGRGIPVLVFQPTAADLEVMAGNALDPAKLGPVCRRAGETTRRRLARADVRDRLAVLAPQRVTVTLDELADDPHRHLARLRTGSPVAFVPALDAYVVTARAEALEVLRDPVSFTVDDPRFSTARVVGPSMLSLDGAAHRAHRDPFVAPFRARVVDERFGPLTRSVVGELLDAVVAGGPPAELRAELAGPLAAAVAAAAVGLDGRDHAIVARLLDWYHEIVASVAGVTAGRPTTAGGDAAMAELTAALPPGSPASDAAVVLFGAIETTEGLILNTLWFLLGQPAELAAVRAQPALVDAAIEEALRLEPPAAQVHRYAARPVTLGGVTIEAGALVVVSLSAANRDPAEFAEPDRFDLYRPNVRRHLAFAAGPHVCLGADLARLEARAALHGLLDRLPGLRLDGAVPAPTGLVFRKPARLPVRWELAADAIVGG